MDGVAPEPRDDLTERLRASETALRAFKAAVSGHFTCPNCGAKVAKIHEHELCFLCGYYGGCCEGAAGGVANRPDGHFDPNATRPN